jgi:hypothetical protein
VSPRRPEPSDFYGGPPLVGTEMRGRFMSWTWERPAPGETAREARARRVRNNAARQRASAYNGAVCAECGHVRANVVHETDPASAPEGAAYYAGWEQHEFVERLGVCPVCRMVRTPGGRVCHGCAA